MTPVTPKIDAHQHFWRYRRADHGWIDPAGPLARDWLPADLRPLLAASGFAGCIAVQAMQDEAETDWLLALARSDPWIMGVVGWTDVTAPDLDRRLNCWAGTRLVGLRHMVQDDPDPAWLLRADAQAGVRDLRRRGLAYDILVRGAQLPHVPAFLDAVAGEEGDGALVLDHAGKPGIAAGEWQPWAGLVAAVARHPAVSCKLSGLVTEADHDGWTADGIARYLDHLLASFGPARLMFGSDWPVCLLAADHRRVVDLVEDFVARTCPAHRDAIFGGTARKAYRLEEH